MNQRALIDRMMHLLTVLVHWLRTRLIGAAVPARARVPVGASGIVPNGNRRPVVGQVGWKQVGPYWQQGGVPPGVAAWGAATTGVRPAERLADPMPERPILQGPSRSLCAETERRDSRFPRWD